MRPAPRRVKIRDIRDTRLLSQLLERYLAILHGAPFHISLKSLAHDTHISESIFHQLIQFQHIKHSETEINPEDFHIVFSNISFLHPTLKMWENPDGTIFFEM
jgi:hypothetical protein